MSDIESNSPKQMDASALLGSLRSNPDLMRNISSMLGKSEDGGAEKAVAQPAKAPPIENGDVMADGISSVLSNKSPILGRSVSPNVLATEGLRKSQSIISTRLPLCARDIARFVEMVVLPSPGTALETIRTMRSCSAIAFSTRIRSKRMDSPKLGCRIN